MTSNPTDLPAPTHATCSTPAVPPAPPAPPGQRLTLRSPEDVLAAVPVVLGFEPRQSVVALTFGGTDPFHARVDLPPPGEDAGLDDLVTQLVDPSVTHRVTGVVLVVYCLDQRWSRVAEQRVAEGFRAAGIEVVLSICADGARWWAPGRPGRAPEPPTGTPYDAAGHQFRAESVLHGRVVHGSREALAALLDAVPPAVAAVRAARRRARSVGADGVGALVHRGVLAGRLEDADLSVLLLSLRRGAGRDAAWQRLERADAGAHVRFWTDVVQRAPADLVAAPAAVLAVAAWLSGHGALAWCAIDRCRAVDPRSTLAALVEQVLVQAVPPSAWEQMRADEPEARGV